VIFIIDRNGRVTNATVQKSTHHEFERPALTAVKKWKFDPGKRGGKPVQFKMRIPITFSLG
jgi:protein TonB